MTREQHGAAPSPQGMTTRNIGERYVGIRKMTDAGDGRQFAISFSSEEPYDRYFGPEILDHGPGAVDLTRLQEIGCVLFNHDRDYVVGKVITAEVSGNRGEAVIEFDKDDAAERIYQKVCSGTLRGVSVGYRVDTWEEVSAGHTSADGRFTGPCSIARKWVPFEVSIVSMPADATVGVGREMDVGHPAPRSYPLSLAQRRLMVNKNILEVHDG